MSITNTEEYPIEFNDVIVEIVDKQLDRQDLIPFMQIREFPCYSGFNFPPSSSGKQKDSNTYDFRFSTNFNKKYISEYISTIKSFDFCKNSIGISRNAIAFNKKNEHSFPVEDCYGFFIHKDLIDTDLLRKFYEALTNIRKTD